MFSHQPTNAPTTAPSNAPPAGQSGSQSSLFSGFGQQQSQPTQSLFGNIRQTQQQQPGISLAGQPTSNQTGSTPSLFGASTVNAIQPPSTGGASAFGGAAWNTGNPLLPKSAFGSGTLIGQAQNGTGLGTSFFGQPQPQQQQQQSTGFGTSLLAPTQNQTQQTCVACSLISLSSDH